MINDVSKICKHYIVSKPVRIILNSMTSKGVQRITFHTRTFSDMNITRRL